MIAIYVTSILFVGAIALKYKYFGLALTYFLAGGITAFLQITNPDGEYTMLHYWWFVQPITFLNLVTGYELHRRSK